MSRTIKEKTRALYQYMQDRGMNNTFSEGMFYECYMLAESEYSGNDRGIKTLRAVRQDSEKLFQQLFTSGIILKSIEKDVYLWNKELLKDDDENKVEDCGLFETLSWLNEFSLTLIKMRNDQKIMLDMVEKQFESLNKRLTALYEIDLEKAKLNKLEPELMAIYKEKFLDHFKE